MDTDPSHMILLFLFSLLLIAFFGGLEIVFATSNKLKIELDRKQKVFASELTSYFSHQPRFFTATILIGKFLFLITLIISFWQICENYLIGHIAYSHYLIPVLVFFVGSGLFVGFVELIPQFLFSHNPNRQFNLLAPLALLFFIVFYPISLLITGISILFSKLFSSPTTEQLDKPEFGRIDLNEYFRQATETLDQTKNLDEEILIFQNALDFSKVKARDCLIPRNELAAIEITDTISNLQNLFVKTGLSKIIVYRESIDHIIGYVHSFELFRKPEHIQNILRPVSFIPEPMPAHEILELLIKQKRNVVVVVDEFGGTAGIITMEDVVEEIFGEIEDEHDKKENAEKTISEGVYEFSARLEIDYLNTKYGLTLPVDNDEYDTLGGLILHLAGDIPEENQELEVGGFTLIPLTVNEKRVESVRVVSLQQKA